MFSLFMIKLTFGCMHCCRDGIVNSLMNSCSCLIPAYVPNVSLCDTKSTQQSESKRSTLLYILLDLTSKKAKTGTYVLSCLCPTRFSRQAISRYLYLHFASLPNVPKIHLLQRKGKEKMRRQIPHQNKFFCCVLSLMAFFYFFSLIAFD